MTAFVEISTGEPGIICPGHIVDFQKDPSRTFNEISIKQLRNYQKLNNSQNTIAFLREINRSSDSAIARLKYGTEFTGNLVPTGYGFPFEGQSIKYSPRNIDVFSLLI
ncbi:MAG: hypothetical protein AAFY16_01900 [Cyanobacteria bacterium J06642_3]